jgi:tetratricopeptide (TPR) repeat protein
VKKIWPSESPISPLTLVLAERLRETSSGFTYCAQSPSFATHIVPKSAAQLKFEDLSIQNDERYDNLMNKSKILDAMGRKQDAEVFKAKALDKASPLQLYFYARQLQGEKKQEEAFALFRSTAKKYPDFWTSHMGLARVYSSQGDFENAVKEVKVSLTTAPDSNKANLENYVKRLQNKEDINR